MCLPVKVDEFDLVAIRVLDEGDFGSSVFHRTRFADDLSPLAAKCLTCLVDIIDPDRNVAEGISQIVLIGVPVIGEFDHTFFGLRTKPNKGIGEAKGSPFF